MVVGWNSLKFDGIMYLLSRHFSLSCAKYENWKWINMKIYHIESLGFELKKHLIALEINDTRHLGHLALIPTICLVDFSPVPSSWSYIWLCRCRSWWRRITSSFWIGKFWVQNSLCHKIVPHKVTYSCCTGGKESFCANCISFDVKVALHSAKVSRKV